MKRSRWRARTSIRRFSGSSSPGGLYAIWLRVTGGLGAVTNLNDQFPWGIWVGFDILCGVGLAAGGFTLCAIVHIFNLEQYKPILRPAILTAFLGYVFVVFALMFDLGRPDRIWHPLVMGNPHSVLFEVAMCVMFYSTVLALEFSPAVFERFSWEAPLKIVHTISVPLIILGVILSTLHQSSLGSLYLIVPHKLHPLWYTPMLPHLVLSVGDHGRAGDDHLRVAGTRAAPSARRSNSASCATWARAGGRDLGVLGLPVRGPGTARGAEVPAREQHGVLPVRSRDQPAAVARTAAFPGPRPQQPGCALRMRGDDRARLHRQPAEHRHHGRRGGIRHHLHSEVDRSDGDAQHHRLRFRHSSASSPSTCPSSRKRTKSRWSTKDQHSQISWQGNWRASWPCRSSSARFLSSVFSATSTCASSSAGAEELLIQSADRITDVIERSTRYQMMHNDRDALYQVIRDMGTEPGIRRVRIFNKEGPHQLLHRSG